MMAWRRVRDERGSAAVEAAVSVPAFVLFVGLIIFGGRTSDREPLVRGIRDLAEGVYDGLTLGAEATFAAEGVDGQLRYEGVATQDDFEVGVDAIRQVYFDHLLPGRPLVLVLEDGDERVLPRLQPARARELRDALVALGAEDVQAA